MMSANHEAPINAGVGLFCVMVSVMKLELPRVGMRNDDSEVLRVMQDVGAGPRILPYAMAV